MKVYIIYFKILFFSCYVRSIFNDDKSECMEITNSLKPYNVNQCIQNIKPVIGILAQEVTPEMKRATNSSTYIASSYVKFIESAGARVVPVMINEPKHYYQELAEKVNGFLFPGGALPVNSESGFGRSGKIIIDISKKMTEDGKPLPIWGTCLGFEMIMFNFAKNDPRQRCHASNIKSKLSFHSGYRKSRMFRNAPTSLIKNLSRKNLTSNFHSWCISPKSFSRQKLKKQFKILTTSFDKDGNEYISTVEHRYYPLYATQWHPEKSQFEWPDSESHNNIPHELEAVEASQYMANFFIQQCRFNSNHFESVEEENELNIHNHNEIFLPPHGITIFQQGYFY